MSDTPASNDDDAEACYICGELEATMALGTESVCEACHSTLTSGGSDHDARESLSDRDIRQHYERVADAVAPLAAIDGNPTVLNFDRWGWYVTRENFMPEDADLGRFEKKRRPRSFADDYADTAARVDRTLYALTSYKHPNAFERWEAATYDSKTKEYEYRDEKPMPGWEDTIAVAA